MKKYKLLLLALILLPIRLFAVTSSMNTEFNTEDCSLTITGTSPAHEATISVYDSNQLVGFKTSTVANDSYEIKFVFANSEEHTLNLTLSGEAGGSETTKVIVIPACSLNNNSGTDPEPIKELFDEGISLIIQGDESSFEEGSFLSVDLYSRQDLYDMIDASPADKAEAIRNALYAMVNAIEPYQLFTHVLIVSVEKNDEELTFDGHEDGFVLGIPMNAEKYTEFLLTHMTRFNDNGTASGEYIYDYDPINEMLVIEIDKPGMFILYDDYNFDFVEESKNQTYTINKDKNLVFAVDGPVDSFEDFLIDGEALSEDDYELGEDENGIFEVTVKENALKNLNEGEHKVEVYFYLGHAETKLNVKKTLIDKITNPETGDKIYIAIASLVLSIAAIAICVLALFKKKNK